MQQTKKGNIKRRVGGGRGGQRYIDERKAREEKGVGRRLNYTCMHTYKRRHGELRKKKR